MDCMPRHLRLQYQDAIYHVTAHGNGRQKIVRDDDDRCRLEDYLGRAVVRCSWRAYAYVIMSNHFHLIVKTPEPNLARGMQVLLSSYANAWARRHRFHGHVFQGRYRTELVEDETYLWTVTRYVHLNPVRARIAEQPAAWPWSSYPGYAHLGRRLEWVAYDELLASWDGALGGGSDPARAYRRFVTAGLTERSESPWKHAHHGWILGSAAFAERIGAMVRNASRRQRRRESRLLSGHSLARVCDVVCASYGVERAELSRRGSPHTARAALAYLARRRTAATNSDLMVVLGLSRPESVPNLTRRFETMLSADPSIREHYERLEEALDANHSVPVPKTRN
jgi:REP element-mobilizing transposase RayT